jgi:hypothetical protein
MQEQDLCIADWRLCFISFDKPQEMHSARTLSGNNRLPVWSDGATIHGTFSGESGLLREAA